MYYSIHIAAYHPCTARYWIASIQQGWIIRGANQPGVNQPGGESARGRKSQGVKWQRGKKARHQKC